MSQIADPISVTVSRGMLSDIVQLSNEFADRMHELLEKNTDGSLGANEEAELKTLVRIAEFGQIISMAIQHESLA